MAKKTIKFKGIEFEEVTPDDYCSRRGVGKDGIMLRAKGKDYYFLPKGKRCKTCGHVLKAVEE